MKIGVSRQLFGLDIEESAKRCAQAWKDPNIPAQQAEITDKEIAEYRIGICCAPYDAFLKSMTIAIKHLNSWPRFLDVGAASGYYHEVLDIGGMEVAYLGCDYSEAFVKAAAVRGLLFDIADVHTLPYQDGFFDIVASGAVIMHVHDWQDAIREMVRVSRRYVLLHRTPVDEIRPTSYWEKEAYGVRMFEIRFSQDDLYQTFRDLHLKLIHRTDVFWNHHSRIGHRNYLLEVQ